MVNPVARLRTVTDGEVTWHMLSMWCPGCNHHHAVNLVGPDGYRPNVCWDWDGNLELPTVSPSLLVGGSVYLHADGTQCMNWHEDYQTETHTQGPCHSFILAGNWQFLADSAHHLAGQITPMVPLPDWLVED